MSPVIDDIPVPLRQHFPGILYLLGGFLVKIFKVFKDSIVYLDLLLSCELSLKLFHRYFRLLLCLLFGHNRSVGWGLWSFRFGLLVIFFHTYIKL